ncbi:hypothetical protein H4R34_001017 [Dimargaris verticillata]|uniref:Uncharacterized protein n=1 Tax=Dimargaris verticillata TaxID=2761393 RepID=A0A9W8B5L0_9FUNG|nr:hypothetical protein H4R34_001017 [Dimargaris verticillata]
MKAHRYKIGEYHSDKGVRSFSVYCFPSLGGPNKPDRTPRGGSSASSLPVYYPVKDVSILFLSKFPDYIEMCVPVLRHFDPHYVVQERNGDFFITSTALLSISHKFPDLTRLRQLCQYTVDDLQQGQAIDVFTALRFIHISKPLAISELDMDIVVTDEKPSSTRSGPTPASDRHRPTGSHDARLSAHMARGHTTQPLVPNGYPEPRSPMHPPPPGHDPNRMSYMSRDRNRTHDGTLHPYGQYPPGYGPPSGRPDAMGYSPRRPSFNENHDGPPPSKRHRPIPSTEGYPALPSPRYHPAGPYAQLPSRPHSTPHGAGMTSQPPLPGPSPLQSHSMGSGAPSPSLAKDARYKNARNLTVHTPNYDDGPAGVPRANEVPFTAPIHGPPHAPPRTVAQGAGRGPNGVVNGTDAMATPASYALPSPHPATMGSNPPPPTHRPGHVVPATTGAVPRSVPGPSRLSPATHATAAGADTFRPVTSVVYSATGRLTEVHQFSNMPPQDSPRQSARATVAATRMVASHSDGHAPQPRSEHYPPGAHPHTYPANRTHSSPLGAGQAAPNGYGPSPQPRPRVSSTPGVPVGLDYRSAGDATADALATKLDRLTAIEQQLEQQLHRSAKLLNHLETAVGDYTALALAGSDPAESNPFWQRMQTIVQRTVQQALHGSQNHRYHGYSPKEPSPASQLSAEEQSQVDAAGDALALLAQNACSDSQQKQQSRALSYSPQTAGAASLPVPQITTGGVGSPPLSSPSVSPKKRPAEDSESAPPSSTLALSRTPASANVSRHTSPAIAGSATNSRRASPVAEDTIMLSGHCQSASPELSAVPKPNMTPNTPQSPSQKPSALPSSNPVANPLASVVQNS